jgi:hypothetical protein
MRIHNRVWLVLVVGGWALVLLSAGMTDGFKHSPSWSDYYYWEMAR